MRTCASIGGGAGGVQLIHSGLVDQIADDLALALELANIADTITMRRYRASDLAIDTKPDLTPVTESDRAVELALRERLAADRSGDAVIGEEFGSDLAGVSRCWILDPIDGTKSYVRGLPTWRRRNSPGVGSRTGTRSGASTR